MRLVGLVSLVALVFLLSFRPLLHHQVLVGKCPTHCVSCVSLWSAQPQLLLSSVAESAWTDETFLSFRVRRRRSSSNSSRERAPWQEPAAGASARRGVGRGEEEDALVHDEGLRARGGTRRGTTGWILSVGLASCCG